MPRRGTSTNLAWAAARAPPAAHNARERPCLTSGADLGGDLVAGPSVAGDAEHQSGAVGDVGGAQVGAEGDGVAAVVVGFDLLAEDGESGWFGHSHGQDGPPVFGGAGIVLVVRPGHLAQEGAIELPSAQAVGECQVARLEPGVLGWPGGR